MYYLKSRQNYCYENIKNMSNFKSNETYYYKKIKIKRKLQKKSNHKYFSFNEIIKYILPNGGIIEHQKKIFDDKEHEKFMEFRKLENGNSLKMIYRKNINKNNPSLIFNKYGFNDIKEFEKEWNKVSFENKKKKKILPSINKI